MTDRPRLRDEALYGLAGRIVRAIDPHTEADPAAVLVTTLLYFASAVGRGPYQEVSGSRHGAILAAVVTGASSKARKGTSRPYVKKIMERAAPDWAPRNVSGLLSGEGLVWAIRDAPTGGRPSDAGPDEGVTDKRLCVTEEEFSAVMKAASRSGSTITEVIRKAWDGERLGGLTKSTPTVCAEPHVSILGHITIEELLRVLSSTDTANGFANRFLWVYADRSKLLPEGGCLTEQAITGLATEVRVALAVARTRGRMERNPAARSAWADIYEDLSRPEPGLFGSLTARSEAQVLRLSLVYALLDGAREIQVPHLYAALALWEYCSESVRHIFGDKLGDPVADQILMALRDEGPKTRTEISRLFSRNEPADSIDRALEELRHRGAARLLEPDRTGQRGRPAERWEAA